MQRHPYKFLTAVLLLMLPAFSFAAEQAPQPGKETSYNALPVSLVIVIVALLFVIALLGKILKSLVAACRKKLKEERTVSATAVRSLLTLLLLLSPLGYIQAQETAAPQAPEMIAGIAAFDFYLLIGVIALELLVIISMLITMAVLIRMLSSQPEAAKVNAPASRPFWDRFHKSVAVEKEQDIMLDHDYDGIKELDNSLPPWWKYGFYLTILVAVVYIYYYHVSGNGPSSLEEYMTEVRKGEEQKARYLALSANKVDENTVVMLDAAGVASGENLFQNTCAACHAGDGGGGVGPNLTDDYWLHGGSLQDIFKSIKYGWPDKGMKSWKDDFSPKQIAELTSYIRSLKGTHPAAPKEKQGDLFTDDGSEKADSTSVTVNRLQ